MTGHRVNISLSSFVGKRKVENALTGVWSQKDARTMLLVGTTRRGFAAGLQEGRSTVVGGRRLEAILERHAHLDFGLQKGTWQHRKSLIRRGVRLVDMETRR